MLKARMAKTGERTKKRTLERKKKKTGRKLFRKKNIEWGSDNKK